MNSFIVARGPMAGFVAAVLLVCAASATAQTPPAPAAADATALAKEQQNPISSMATMPWQFNFNSGGGLEDRTLFLLNVQPVMPFKVSADWNMIVRTVVPVVSAPGPETQPLHGHRRHPGAALPDAVQGQHRDVGLRPRGLHADGHDGRHADRQLGRGADLRRPRDAGAVGRRRAS